MDYCAPLGIPHSAFLRWPADDQDKAVFWARERALACPGCGTRRDEWVDDPFAYVAQAVQCPGCEAIEQERGNIEEAEKELGPQRGVSVALVPRRAARSERISAR